MNNHTPLPWIWKQSGNCTMLCTPDRGQLVIMDFVRCGMNGAEPRFAVWEGKDRGRLGGILKPAKSFKNLYDHPDARLIAMAPALYEALKHVVAACAESASGEYVRGVVANLDIGKLIVRAEEWIPS